MPDTIISWLNALGQGKPNDLQLRDCKKHPIGELNITGLGAG